DLHIDHAEGVDEPLDAVEVDQGDVVDGDPGVVLDRRHRQPHAPVGQGRVDAVLAAPGHVDVQVAGEGGDVDALVVLGDVHQHHHVRALTADALRGRDLRGAPVRSQPQEVTAGAVDLLGPLTVGGAAGDLHDRALLVGVLQPVEIVPDHQAEAEHEHAH